MKSGFLLFFYFVFLSVSGLAQNGSIRGVISDAATGETLVGANVLIQGT
jgi:hypothetical protein